MAKLRDLQELLSRVGDVTPARANVLIMNARKLGYFTRGGRGTSAPDICASDVTNGLLLALQFNPPIEAPESIPALRSLPLLVVRHDPGDGTFRDLDPETSYGEARISKTLPPCFPAFQGIQFLGSALDAVFSAGGAAFVNRFDRIAHTVRDGGSEVILEVADPDWSQGAWPEGPRAWAFVFQIQVFETAAGGFGTRTTRTIHAEALRALADLIRREGE
jgi:hypothetical protein